MYQSHTISLEHRRYVHAAFSWALLLGVFCTLIVTRPLHAYDRPSWQNDGGAVDTTAFQNIIRIPAHVGAVPETVALQVPQSYRSSKHGVVVSGNGATQDVVYVDSARVQAPVLTVASDTGDASLSRMTDNSFETYAALPFTEAAENTYSITIRSPKPLTTDGLTLILPQNVALPTYIAIRSRTSGAAVETLVARQRVMSNHVPFPETTTSELEVVFWYAQPLRIAELELSSIDADLPAPEVRFIMQPNETYTLYLHADRPFGSAPFGGANLAEVPKEDVRTLEALGMERNPDYVPADADEDGVPDLNDNCTSESNPQQEDIDRNGRGDVCDDFDRDGLQSSRDNCPKHPNVYQEDTDSDGIGDACDEEENRFTERNQWVPFVGLGVAASVLVGLFALTAIESRKKKCVEEKTTNDVPPVP